jgi:GH24 family phage-related lysozyme (muramidase)/transcriptional regulator with XRE-family HTH domain
MAGNSSVLKEFLVKIGFKIDETKYRDFQESMRATAKNAVEMSKTALAATTVMGAGLKVVAQQMENLYFATRRTGASATELKELGFAAEQVGVSAEQARGAVEGLAAARRTNPGLNGILGGMGIDPRQTDNAKVLVQLLTKLHSMPYFQGAQVAGLFGISEQTFAMLEQGLPEMQKYLALREKMYRAAGVSPDDVSKRSHEFNTQLRILEAALETLTEIIAYRLMPAGEKVIEWLTSVVGWLIRADTATGGWSSRILGIASALAGGSLLKGGLGFIGKLLGRGGATAAAEGAGGETAAAAGGGILSITGGLVAAAVGLALIVFNRGIAEKVTGWLGLDPKGHQITDAVKSMASKVGSLAHNAAQHVAAYVPKVTGDLARMVAGFEGYRDHAYRDVAGNQTAFFGHKLKPGENVAGMDPLRVLMNDLATTLAAVHKLVKVHLGRNQENALADFVFNVGANKFANSTMLRRLNSGDFAGAADQFQHWNYALVNGHMTTLKALTDRRSAEASLFRAPDRPITIQQKADYHINSTDPQGAASEVHRRQAQLNSDMVRNLAGAVE